MRVFIVSVAFLFALAPQAVAAGPEDVANDISNNVMSPFCPGVTLHDCPSETALELRAEIEEWASSGMGRAEIMAELETQFGPEIRAVPQASGSGLFAWLLPAVGVLAAAALGIVLSKRWSGGNGAEIELAGAPPTSEERNRLERELRGLRDGP